MPLQQSTLSAPAAKIYEFMPVASTYAQGKAALNETCKQELSTAHPLYILPDGSHIYRPLTMRENFQAQVEDFWTLKDQHGKKRTLDDRLRLFTPRTDSCTSLTYKGGTRDFTIIPQDESLITLPADFLLPAFCVAYPASPMVRLDSSKGKYNCGLTERDVLDHEGWLAAMEGDQHLLQERARITFSMFQEKYDRERGMGFYVNSFPQQNMRRALFVGNLSDYGSAYGDVSLNYSGSFLRVVAHRRLRAKK